MYRIQPIESVSAHGTHTPMRAAGASCLATLGSAFALAKDKPASVAIFFTASAAPSCAGKIHEPAGNSVPPTEKLFSAISILNFASAYRAASRLSYPVSRSKNTGPAPVTVPAGFGTSITAVNDAVRIVASAVGIALR